jgi:hypothetical protein
VSFTFGGIWFLLIELSQEHHLMGCCRLTAAHCTTGCEDQSNPVLSHEAMMSSRAELPFACKFRAFHHPRSPLCRPQRNYWRMRTPGIRGTPQGSTFGRSGEKRGNPGAFRFRRDRGVGLAARFSGEPGHHE